MLEINRKEAYVDMSYVIHGDMDSSSHRNILLYFYPYRHIKCPPELPSGFDYNS
jgi:hypothetical protein